MTIGTMTKPSKILPLFVVTGKSRSTFFDLSLDQPKGEIDMELKVREDKHTLRDLVLLAIVFRMISYEFGKELLEDLDEFSRYEEDKIHEKITMQSRGH